jgi:Icc-related predicted phosphoesterase
MIRIICISDTHSLHSKIKIENYINPKVSNILIHAGDCTNVGREKEVGDFINWYQNLEFDTKIFIAGNHDISFENKPNWLNTYLYEENLHQSNVTYLRDDSITIDFPEFSRPIKIYGSPWQPEFYNWAFNLPRDGEELKKKWEQIPNDTDILITHGPAFGMLDYVMDKYGQRNVGCELLKERIDVLKPLMHVFGHIHYSYGTEKINDTLFVNASICTEQYNPINEPIVVDLTEVDGKFVVTVVKE